MKRRYSVPGCAFVVRLRALRLLRTHRLSRAVRVRAVVRLRQSRQSNRIRSTFSLAYILDNRGRACGAVDAPPKMDVSYFSPDLCRPSTIRDRFEASNCLAKLPTSKNG